MKKNLLIILLFLPFLGISQQSVEFTLGVGATAVDIEGIVEKDEISGTFATDWGVTNVGVSGQYFFVSNDQIAFGAELMYQSLYWYSVRVPYGSQPIYREYSVSTMRLTPILRIGANNAFAFDIGPELNFMNGVKPGLMLSANYNIPVSENIDIPIKARLDIMSNIVVTVPVSLNAGVRVKL